MRRKNHNKMMFERIREQKNAETQAKEEKVRSAKRKIDRRIARETKVKESIKQVLKHEILKNIVDKGEVRYPCQNYELLDVYMNYNKNKATLTNLGGYF
jgi:hypothetical protein